MQDYTYSAFSILALALHLIFNRDILFRRRIDTAHGRSYRLFLVGVLAYYVSDAAWGIFAGLRWIVPWYVDTLFFFLSLVLLVFLWSRFAADYLAFGRTARRVLDWCGYALLAFNLAAMAVNPFTRCLFFFDDQGVYHVGWLRDPAFYLVVGYGMFTTLLVVANGIRRRDFERRRSAMVVLCGVAMSVAMIMQVAWPLTPFTSLGCLIVNCFFQVFVIQDERLAKYTAELERALERARTAEKARSMFFSIVSHDIRTPLNAIIGYSELLQEGTESEAERNEALKSIRASGKTLLQLVNDVLALAKMDAGKMALRPEPVILNQLTDEVFSSFWRDASEKGVRLVNGTDGVPTVMIDGHRFRQILFNLIGNAVKFTKTGSVEVRATYSEGVLVVSVVDTGCGIAPDMVDRVLEPFVQAIDPSHAADRAAGTGLGLSICRRLVETMGGEIDVQSELGKGSTFTVRIPGVEVLESGGVGSGGVESGGVEELTHPLTHSPTPPLPHSPTPNSRHVLVVDDSPVNRKVLTAFLKRAGIERIDQAGDGVEALEKLDSALKSGDPHDFVLSDYWMPNMNGLELIERIRADARFSSLHVVAVTADTECRKDARSGLFSGILLKPVTYDQIAEAMGGELDAESEIGKGSTFTIRVPCAVAVEAKAEAVAEPKHVVDPMTLPKRVLVVDDSATNRLVLKAHLKRAGVASVDFACDGAEALGALDAAAKAGAPYDIVFTDFWMPNMNGMELIEKLRADPRFAVLPVYAVTADAEYRNDPRSDLFTGVLLKPMTFDVLTSIL